jgi:hypothetical protein
MWCRLPGRGEFFSKGLQQAVSGTANWSHYEIPFYLKKGQKPDLIKLNLAVEGAGTVWLRNIELLRTRLLESWELFPRRLVKLDRISVRIFDLDLPAPRPRLHLVPKVGRGGSEGGDDRVQAVDVKDDPVPPAGFLTATVWSRP